MKRVLYTKPSVTELEVRYARDAAEHGWGDNWNRYISRFEELFRQHLGVKYCAATSSCTGALHLGLAAAGIGPGDEVILADINWIASAAPVTYLGAKPVFVDILPDSWCIDPGKIESAVTPRTKAIIAVHLYGNLCEIDELRSIAREKNLVLVEDAAEAIGSSYKGKRAGSMGDFAAFSFHGTKTVTTGEGGMFATDDEGLFRKVQALNNHGRKQDCPKQFWPEMIGYKYKISNLQAAVGCAQVERIDELIGRKREIFNRYRSLLGDVDGIQMNPEPDGCVNGYWMPTVVFEKHAAFDREVLLRMFAQNNIDARVFFYPLSSLPMFKECSENTVSYDIFARAINLPSYHDITEDKLARVVKTIKEYLSGM